MPPDLSAPIPPIPPIPPVPVHWTFPADPRSVARARRAVVEALPRGHRPQLADDLRLLASELVTNAVRHGASPADEHVVELVLWPADGHYWLAVSDPGSGVPAAGAAGPEACNGRGLLLVDAVSTAWAVVPRRTSGKSVVAGLRLHAG